jgi:arylsulfatase A-like enzyme
MKLSGKSLLYVVLTILLYSSIGCQQANTGDNSEKPNIVWLVTEDNSKHFLKLYDESGASMPNVEALADKGIVFNHAFSNAPVCSVARSALITGCYGPRIGAQYHRKMQVAPMPKGLKMFPAYLKKAGYYTSNNSKEDYNLQKNKDVWDESSKSANYKNRKAGQPFFHVQNFGITHEGQLHFSAEKMDAFNYNTDSIKLFPYHPDTRTFRNTYAHYYNLHKKADDAIGKFIAQLKEDGLMENTIVFYYGDHGGVLPRSKGYLYESGLHIPLVVYVPEKWKHLVPMELGSRTDAFVEFIDFGPTVLNLAGIPVPKTMDGKPFLGENISKDNLKDHNSTFSYADRFDEKYDMVRAIRKGKYKYMRNYQPFNMDGLFNFYRYKMLAYKEWKELYDAGSLNEIQKQFFEARTPEALFDVEKDPHEINNLAGNNAFTDVLIELRTELQNKVKAMPDLSFFPEPYFLEKGLNNPVAFGQKNKKEIAEMVDIADLSLQSFEKINSALKSTLESADPWKRYWGLIVCSSFGAEASMFQKKAHEMVLNDPENLVRIRALEFLALTGNKINPNNIYDIINNITTESTTALALNSVALIKTLHPDLDIDLPRTFFDPSWIENANALVNRRIEFINESN